MKMLISEAGTFGPFREIIAVPEDNPDRLWCDGVEYQFDTIGDYETPESGPGEPTPLVPEEVPMLNAHLVLIAAGKMTALQDIVAALPEQEQQEAQAYLNLAQTCRRDNKWVLLMGPALGYDDAGLDQMFIDAGALNP